MDDKAKKNRLLIELNDVVEKMQGTIKNSQLLRSHYNCFGVATVKARLNDLLMVLRNQSQHTSLLEGYITVFKDVDRRMEPFKDSFPNYYEDYTSCLNEAEVEFRTGTAQVQYLQNVLNCVLHLNN